MTTDNKEGKTPTYWGWDWPPDGKAAVVMPAPRDLQILVTKYGGYHRIPADAWADYHDRCITVWVWLAHRHFPPTCRRYSGTKLKYPRPRQKRDIAYLITNK
jgi:hypothetical protein